MENTLCLAFKEYEEVLKTVPLDFMEDDVMWVASKLFGTTGLLGEEAIKMRSWIINFGFALEDLKALVVNLDEYMYNYSPPWAAYCARMAFCLVILDKSLGVCPVGIREKSTGPCQHHYEGCGGPGEDDMW